jgi:hypothetical protein
MGNALNKRWIRILVSVLIAESICTSPVHAVKVQTTFRDPRQFRFGFEPTRTNPRILLESGKAVAKKFVTGKGDGVLAAELPIATKYRSKFIADLKKTCPECKVFEARESHGEVTFHIEFPDEYYIRSSLDAGALEWQTKPSTIPEIRKQVPVLQREVFDRAKTVGVGYSIEATGGHTTFSGFGNDTFWYGNYLKFRTKNTHLDWGFFGKDGYNATPVSLWAKEQQQKYVKVHQEHDAKWKKFLIDLESALERGASDQELIRLYETRDLMKQDEYASRLLEIYYNPKLENQRLGKRSKPKYVANKPYVGGLIENRAIRPQRNAEELLKMAEFIEAEAWYVKERLNEGMEVRFNPNTYVEESKSKVAREARKMIETLGLDWERYKDLSPAGDVELKGVEKELASDFSKKNYGAKKRDELFRRLRDHFLAKKKLTGKESVFLADLLNEMSYTVPEAIENSKIFKERFSGKSLLALSSDEANRMIQSTVSFSEKFPAAASEILEPVQDHLKTYVVRSLRDEGLVFARKVVPSMAKAARDVVLNMVESLHSSKPSHAKFGLYADLVLDAGENSGHEKKYLETIMEKYDRRIPNSLPARFDEVAKMSKNSDPLKPFVRNATESVVGWTLDPKNARMKIGDQDADLLRWLAAEKQSRSRDLLAPLRSHYWEQLNENQFGVKNFYKAQVDYDRLYEITAASERKQFLETTLVKVKDAHRIANNPDTASLVERVEGHLEAENAALAGGGCNGSFFSKLKRMFRK